MVSGKYTYDFVTVCGVTNHTRMLQTGRDRAEIQPPVTHWQIHDSCVLLFVT